MALCLTWIGTAQAQETISSQNLAVSASYPTYSDNFQRANGPLGPDWTQVEGASCALQIISDSAYARETPCLDAHALEGYTAGRFANNQWSSYVVRSGDEGNPLATQSAVVRNSGAQGYNDADIPAGDYQIGTINPLADFCQMRPLRSYSAGDRHELDVAGSGPVFFWSRRNGAVDATCVDTSAEYTGGVAGVGVIEMNSKPTAQVGSWEGGSLPDFSTTPSDNFQRADAGWLGVNWFLVSGLPSSLPAYFKLSKDSAVLNASGTTASSLAIWTTPFSVNQASTVTAGRFSGGWIGAVTRYTVRAGAGEGGTFYIALWSSGKLYLFADTGSSYIALATLRAATAPSTIELDACGVSPVNLTVKSEGKTVMSYSDSTYKYTGTYVGFGVYGSRATRVAGWTGANF